MVKLLSESKCFGGVQRIYQHLSNTAQCDMRFGLFLPSDDPHQNYPLLFWLSGLTCTEENFIVKTHMQSLAVQYGFAVVNPDTSPRGLNYPGENERYDFGTGAGFYVDAIEKPWINGYRMYSYVTQELPDVLAQHFSLDLSRVAVMGHSMGGHGALMVALRNPSFFRSVSAFSPICSVVSSPWGQNALNQYLGDNMSQWQAYDVVHLLKTQGWQGPAIRIDFGTKDEYLNEQLKPELLEEAIEQQSAPIKVYMQEGYDHSFYFVKTFLESHFKLHAINLEN